MLEAVFEVTLNLETESALFRPMVITVQFILGLHCVPQKISHLGLMMSMKPESKELGGIQRVFLRGLGGFWSIL
jgi:hypothetical protein